MNILILLAGDSKPFEEAGYTYPKYLIEVAGRPLFQHVVESIGVRQQDKLVFIVRREEAERFHFKDSIRLLVPNSEVIIAEGQTQGAACTALLATEIIQSNESLLIVNGDQIVDKPLEDILQDFETQEIDGGIVIFDSVHPRWSYVKTNSDGFVIEAAEKRPISRNATAGLYYFRRGHEFVDAAMDMIRKDAQTGGAFYVCPVYNQMLLRQAKIRTYTIQREQYFSLANPQGLQAYEERIRTCRPQELMK